MKRVLDQVYLIRNDVELIDLIGLKDYNEHVRKKLSLHFTHFLLLAFNLVKRQHARRREGF